MSPSTLIRPDMKRLHRGVDYLPSVSYCPRMRTASARRVGRPPGPPADVEQRRSELLDAAARAIRRIGPSASMDEIAAEAGMTKPILYAAFGDKAGLASALAQRSASDLMPVVLGAFEQNIEPRAMVHSAIDSFIDFVERDPAVYRFLVRGVASDPSFVEQELVVSFGLALARILSAGMRDAGADPAPAEAWSFAILGAVFAAAEWWLVSRSMTRSDLVEHLTTLVWTGIANTAIGGSR